MSHSNEISTYEYTRELIIGSRAGLVIETPDQCESRTDFDGFVTAYYVGLYEILADDAAFLRRVKVLSWHPVIGILKNLRTAIQHKGDTKKVNQKAKRVYADWIGVAPYNWEKILEPLVPLVHEYLIALIAAANVVRNSPELSTSGRWTPLFLFPLFSKVFAETSVLLFTQIPRKPKSVKLKEDIEGNLIIQKRKKVFVTNLCVQEVLSENPVLPIDYSSFLDELGILGSPDARSAITLAYATAQKHPGLKEEDFRRKVSELWWSLAR